MQTKSFITGEKNILKILKLQGLVGEMLQITENIALGSLRILYIFASCMGKPVTFETKVLALPCVVETYIYKVAND